MPAILDRLSPRVVYTSRWGCPAIPDVTDPQAGPDASASLQALADLARSGPLEVVVDQPLLCNQISLYSGTTIRGLYPGSYRPGDAAPPGIGLWMKRLPASGAGAGNTCVLRNAHWASNYDGASSSLSVSRVVDRDIAIRHLFIDGQRRNGVSNSSYGGSNVPQVNVNGEYIIPLRFHGMYNLLVEDVHIYDPCMLHTAFSNIAWSTFRDLHFCDPSYWQGNYAGGSNQTDGLHFVGPASDIEIDGLYGATGDDFLALNFAEGNLNPTDIYPPTNISGAGPHVWGGWPVVYYGDGLRINARNLYPYNAADVMRIQTLQDNQAGLRGNVVDQVTVSDVRGSVIEGLLQSDSYGYGTPGGHVGRVTLRDWDVTFLPDPAYVCGYQFYGQWNDVRIINHHYGDPASAALQVNLISGASVGRLELRDHVIREDASGAPAPPPPILVADGAVDELVVADSGWYRAAATNQAFVSVTGGSVNRLALRGASTNNLANVVSWTGGTVGEVGLDLVRHRNPDGAGPAGGAILNVGSGLTLPLLVTCGATAAAVIGTSAGAVAATRTGGI